MGGPRDYHTEWSKSEKDILYDITYVKNLKNNTNEFFYKTNRLTAKRFIFFKWLKKNQKNGISWHVKIMWNSSFGVHMESFIGTLPHPFIYAMSAAATTHKSTVEELRRLYDLPIDPKIFTSWCFTEWVCRPQLYAQNSAG